MVRTCQEHYTVAGRLSKRVWAILSKILGCFQETSLTQASRRAMFITAKSGPPLSGAGRENTALRPGCRGADGNHHGMRGNQQS